MISLKTTFFFHSLFTSPFTFFPPEVPGKMWKTLVGKPPVCILIHPLSSLSSPHTQTPVYRLTLGNLTSHQEMPFLKCSVCASFASSFPIRCPLHYAWFCRLCWYHLHASLGLAFLTQQLVLSLAQKICVIAAYRQQMDSSPYSGLLLAKRSERKCHAYFFSND